MGKSVVCVYLQQQEGGTTKYVHSLLLCLDLPFLYSPPCGLHLNMGKMKPLFLALPSPCPRWEGLICALHATSRSSASSQHLSQSQQVSPPHPRVDSPLGELQRNCKETSVVAPHKFSQNTSPSPTDGAQAQTEVSTANESQSESQLVQQAASQAKEKQIWTLNLSMQLREQQGNISWG